VIDAVGTGAAAGLVVEALVLRLNPEVAQTLSGVVVGMPLWATWGMLVVGLPTGLVLLAQQWVRPKPDRWAAPVLFAGVFTLGAVFSMVNAEFHAYMMPGSAYWVLFQDAVSWTVALLLAVGLAAVVRRLGSRPRDRLLYSVVILLLPVLRVAWVPTPEREYLDVAARPLGPATRQLLVIGLEGLDSKVLLADSVGSNLPTLRRLREEGARAVLQPHRPYLRQALWTTVATGTLPGQHGVKDAPAWDLPVVTPETMRLMPWTPLGSRLMLPWGLAERVPPPPATVAPLWARQSAAGSEAAVFGWPGSWGADPVRIPTIAGDPEEALEPAILQSLTAALAPLPSHRQRIWRAIARDQAQVRAAARNLTAGGDTVWIHLETLAQARRYHEPLRSRHTYQRRLLAQVLELVDLHLETLLTASAPDALVVVVSPNGLRPPGSFERFQRLLGFGGEWHASADSSPDGLLVMMGGGVRFGGTVPIARPPDVAPTVCYLLDLPVARYMDGSVIVDLVDPGFLADRPLRVVE
jgi:hypothetical protein